MGYLDNPLDVSATLEVHDVPRYEFVAPSPEFRKYTNPGHVPNKGMFMRSHRVDVSFVSSVVGVFHQNPTEYDTSSLDIMAMGRKYQLGNLIPELSCLVEAPGRAI